MPARATSYLDLKTAFTHKNFDPLYFLYGDESYLVSELEEILIENALEPHEKDFNLDIIYGAEAETDQVIAICASYPVMATRRVVIIRDFDKLKDNRKFQAYADKPNTTAIVAATCRTKPNMATNPYRALKKAATSVEFKPLKDRDLGRWINDRIHDRGYEIDGRAVEMLIEFVGSDLRTAAGEIDKLLSYLGTRQKVSSDDVLLASGQTREINVFELQKVVGQGQYTRALDIAERLLQQASNPRSEAVRIIAILSAYFTKLWRLSYCQENGMRDGQMAQHIGVQPYFIKEYVRSLRFFDRNRIQTAFKLLLAADFEIKGGSTRDERLIINLLLRGLIPVRATEAA